MPNQNDGWELGPVFPPEIEGMEPNLPRQEDAYHFHVRRWAVGPVMGAAMIFFLAKPNKIDEPLPTPKVAAAQKHSYESRERSFFIGHAVKRAISGRFDACHVHPDLPPQFFKWWQLKKSNQQIETVANRLHRAEGLPPLQDAQLLNQNAAKNAEYLAEHPQLISHYGQTNIGNNNLVLRGIAASKWAHVNSVAIHAGNGQTATAAACLVDNQKDFSQINNARYIGVSSAKIPDNSRVWVIDFGSK